jgi:D-alanyl-D-alanine carboxypeptidase (penicillin-binding protein 5/6)
MKKTLIGISVLKAAVMLAVFLYGANPACAATLPIDTLAKQAIIVDANTGAVLLDKNANEKMPTSSMSKTMTAYMVFEALKTGHLKLTDEMLVSEKAWRMAGSKMFIKVGDRVKVEDLVRGIVIQSGNDATVAMAEGISGTEEAFIQTMNARAQELGMKDSNFMNASGWPDPNHYSTPRDLALLAYRIIQDFPEYYGYFSEREFTYNKIKQQNRDPLLGRVPGADGLKTGHTEVAGYGLIGSAIRDGRRVILVVNGLSSDKERQEESVRLMEWAFRNFETRTVATASEPVEQAKVWLGVAEEVPLVPEKDVQILVSRANRNDYKLTTHYQGPLNAPVKKGDVVGKLKIEVPGQPTAEVNLLAGGDVEKKGIFARAYAKGKYMLTGSY